MKEELKTKDYKSYLEHQKEKTTDPIRIKKWLNEEWDIKLNGFKEIFKKYIDLFDKNGKCVGLGARTGQEIAALRDLGFKDSIGVDLVPFEPYTIEADFHDLPFEDTSVSMVYSNTIDHVKNPILWSSEIKRILVEGGFVLMHLQIGLEQDEYSVFDVHNPRKQLIKPFFKNFRILKNSKINTNVHGMNWEILLKKKKPFFHFFK